VIRCMHCHAETSNGLALCELCQRQVQLALVYLPIHFRNLSRWQPGRAGSRPVPGSTVLYDGTTRDTGTGDRISDRLDEAANMLTTWARALADARPRLAVLLERLALARAEERITEAEAVAWLCRGFGKFLPSVATTDWCGEFVRDVAHHEAVLNGLNDLVPGWYAGACRHCRTPTSVIPGLTWVTCGGCGATTYARDHLDVVLDEARDWVARPKALAVAIVMLVDTEDSSKRLYDRIRQWSKRGELAPVRRVVRDYEWDDETERMVVADVEVGHARYRMGDVLDLALRDTRRANPMRSA
jgi:hypothetical protein